MHKGHNNEQKIPRWQYSIISEISYDKDIGQFHTYGIQINGPNHKEILHDVSIFKNTVNYMAELFNLHQLSPIHLKDAVEDLSP